MKPARLRPAAREDRRQHVRWYRHQAGTAVATKLVDALRQSLQLLTREPRVGSPRAGELIGMPGLRCWRITGFPLLWVYVDRPDELDVLRLLGERQNVHELLADELTPLRRDPRAAEDAIRPPRPPSGS